MRFLTINLILYFLLFSSTTCHAHPVDLPGPQLIEIGVETERVISLTNEKSPTDREIQDFSALFPLIQPQVSPEYPSTMMRMRSCGSVEFSIKVLPDGSPASFEIHHSTREEFSNSVQKAVDK